MNSHPFLIILAHVILWTALGISISMQIYTGIKLLREKKYHDKSRKLLEENKIITAAYNRLVERYIELVQKNNEQNTKNTLEEGWSRSNKSSPESN